MFAPKPKDDQRRRRAYQRQSSLELQHKQQAISLTNQRVSNNLAQLIRYPNHVDDATACLCKVCEIRKQQMLRDSLKAENIYPDEGEQQFLARSIKQPISKPDDLLGLLLHGLAYECSKTLRLYTCGIIFFEDGSPSDMYYTSYDDQRVKRVGTIITLNACKGLLRKQYSKYQQMLKIAIQVNAYVKKHDQVTRLLKTLEPPSSSRKTPTEEEEESDQNKQPSAAGLQTEDHKYLVKYRGSNLFQQINEPQLKAMFRQAFKFQSMQKKSRKGNFKTPLHEVCYIRCLVHPFHPQKGVLTSSYFSKLHATHPFVERAQLECAILTDQIGRYDQRYISPDVFDDQAQEIKKTSSMQQYLFNMTCRIVVFVKKTLKVRTLDLRLRWVVNEAENAYLVDVLDWIREPIPEKKQQQLCFPLVAKDTTTVTGVDETGIHATNTNPLLTSINNDETYFVDSYRQLISSVNKSSTVPIPSSLKKQAPNPASASPCPPSTINKTVSISTSKNIRGGLLNINHSGTKMYGKLRSGGSLAQRSPYSLSKNQEFFVTAQTNRVLEYSRAVYQKNLKARLLAGSRRLQQSFNESNQLTEQPIDRSKFASVYGAPKANNQEPRDFEGRQSRKKYATSFKKPKKYYLSAMKGQVLNSTSDKVQLQFPSLFL